MNDLDELRGKLAYSKARLEAAEEAMRAADAKDEAAFAMGGGIPGFGGSGNQRAARQVRSALDSAHRAWKEATERIEKWTYRVKSLERRIAELERVRFTADDLKGAVVVKDSGPLLIHRPRRTPSGPFSYPEREKRMNEPKVARNAEERGEGICQTCLSPIWNEGGTIGRRKRDTGWSDRIERGGDSLVCFKAVGYRHVPLKDREAEIYDVALARSGDPADASGDERVARYLAIATPLGYQSALSVVGGMTRLIEAETDARRAAVSAQVLS